VVKADVDCVGVIGVGDEVDDSVINVGVVVSVELVDAIVVVGVAAGGIFAGFGVCFATCVVAAGGGGAGVCAAGANDFGVGIKTMGGAADFRCGECALPAALPL